MNYESMRKYDIANGVGIRTTLFVTGCTHNCFNCFNADIQDFQAGQPWDDEAMNTLLSYVKDEQVRGLTLLGGEPFQNVPTLTEVVRQVREAVPEKDIWVYSGYVWKDLMADPTKLELLQLCDVLVDGPYVDHLRDPMLQFRGSSNQRIIDIKASFLAGEVVLLTL